MGVGKTVATNEQGLASDINSMAGWGAIGARPNTEDVVAGSFYYDTTNGILYQEQNGSWVAILQIKTLNPANETVEAGYYAATTLSAVDADLAAANIKGGVTIFGKAGTYAGPTHSRSHTVDLGAGANYVPGDAGFFSSAGEVSIEWFIQLQGNVWSDCIKDSYGTPVVIGDGTNLRFFNNDGVARELAVMRLAITDATFERYHYADLGATTAYVPADEGLFSHATESALLTTQYKYNANWLHCKSGNHGETLAIGDGTNFRVYNSDASARETVLMRFVLS